MQRGREREGGGGWGGGEGERRREGREGEREGGREGESRRDRDLEKDIASGRRRGGGGRCRKPKEMKCMLRTTPPFKIDTVTVSNINRPRSLPGRPECRPVPMPQSRAAAPPCPAGRSCRF